MKCKNILKLGRKRKLDVEALEQNYIGGKPWSKFGNQ
jgi:hypothetical protein